MAKATCSVEGCDRLRQRREWCDRHYRRVLLRDSPPCSIDGCDGQSEKRGWCAMHYSRWRLHGDPNYRGNIRLRQSATVEERFWAKVSVGHPLGCWVWIGARDPNGYGYFGSTAGTRLAHRIAYEWLVGKIPDGLVLDHLCCNPPCVNPDHLEPVNRYVNGRRGGMTVPRRTIEGDDNRAEIVAIR